MSGGQQGGPMGGGGKGGTQQMPSGGGKGGPQGHMMPNGQRQVRPGMGGPMGGQGLQPSAPFTYGGFAGGAPQPQSFPGMPTVGGLPPQRNLTPIGTMPSFANVNPVGQSMTVGGPNSAGFSYAGQVEQPRGQPQTYPGMTSGGLPPQQMGTPGRQPTPMRGLLAKLYGG